MVDRKKESAKLAKRIGKNIAERRKALHWTQYQLAERIGVDAETISRFERGVNLPSLLTLLGLAEALRISAGELLSRIGQNQSAPTAICETWMAGLSPRDQEFMMNTVASYCEHLRQPR
jgi:transcriptional regulator with XRE-family HTH domain